MQDRIQRWAWIIVSGAVIALVAYLTIEQAGAGAKIKRVAEAKADGAAAASATPLASGNVAASGSGAPTPNLEVPEAGVSLFDTLMADAGSLPTGAPRSVRLGVVLVQFAGAEGASSSARGKADALKHATTLLEEARTDFKAAVKAGDSGSAEDIGRIPRGVLERTTEVAVFSLGPGDVSEPIETPRGYWIVKRIE